MAVNALYKLLTLLTTCLDNDILFTFGLLLTFQNLPLQKIIRGHDFLASLFLSLLLTLE